MGPWDPYQLEKTATPGYKRLQGLTIAQQHAIDLLLRGQSDQATADALGPHRVSASRWRSCDPAFRAALNLRRRERCAGAVARLQALADKALEAPTQDLQKQPFPACTAPTRLAGIGKLARPPARGRKSFDLYP